MQYDFDKVIDRSNNHSAKYDERMKKFNRADIIPLWIADMDFQVAQPIMDAMEDKCKHGIFGYVSRPQEYWDALCDWQKRRNNWEVNKDLISFTVGVVPALHALVRQLSQPGDEVLIQAPVYAEFYHVIERAQRKLLINRLVEQNGTYQINFEDFEQKLKRRPKFFILCNPQNPVGRCWTREELKRMGELCLSYQVPVISDEIHADLMLWGNRHTVMASISPEIGANTITCTSVTKTFNLAGLQAASVIFPNAVEKQGFDAFWNQLEINRNNCFSLVASIAAYRHGEQWLSQLITYLEGNMLFIRDYCKQHILQIKPNLPQCTYLVWLDCRMLHMDDQALQRFMVEQAGIGLNAGVDFDRELGGHLRLNAACPRSVLEQALKQLKEAVDKL